MLESHARPLLSAKTNLFSLFPKQMHTLCVNAQTVLLFLSTISSSMLSYLSYSQNEQKHLGFMQSMPYVKISRINGGNRGKRNAQFFLCFKVGIAVFALPFFEH
ncbi:hypothetical protein VN23_00500 [Janthinobacterium sp. B9-8]|nr:hypothetical protein VN23_00500 [Janthinobacterium sp. B9-8]